MVVYQTTGTAMSLGMALRSQSFAKREVGLAAFVAHTLNARRKTGHSDTVVVNRTGDAGSVETLGGLSRGAIFMIDTLDVRVAVRVAIGIAISIAVSIAVTIDISVRVAVAALAFAGVVITPLVTAPHVEMVAAKVTEVRNSRIATPGTHATLRQVQAIRIETQAVGDTFVISGTKFRAAIRH
jgi:hypothetical protein